MARPKKTKQNEKKKSKRICFDDSVVKNLPIQETQATRVQSLAWEDPMEEGMATQSSVPALEIPWNPVQCSCLGNPMDRAAWQATVHGTTKNQT